MAPKNIGEFFNKIFPNLLKNVKEKRNPKNINQYN
jgi:hypothetical protein